MAVPYLGEIRMFAFGRTPNGWQQCDGSLLPISTYDALFALIGTTYGGDGQTTFAVPDLRGRAPIHQGAGPGLGNYAIGQTAGSETVTLTVPQLPAHAHAVAATGAATLSSPEGRRYGTTIAPTYVDTLATGQFAPEASALVGGSLPHNNMMPSLTVSFAIATAGIFPQQA